MATTTARNQQDVDNMSKKDRLWDSMNYTYGLQREASDKSYDQEYSQTDRHNNSRGMGRTSYNNQILANIQQRKIEAQNNIYNSQIADYENRLQDLENTEWQQAFQEQQFAYQKERDAEADRQWQLAFDASQAANAASGRGGSGGAGGTTGTTGNPVAGNTPQNYVESMDWNAFLNWLNRWQATPTTTKGAMGGGNPDRNNRVNSVK